MPDPISAVASVQLGFLQSPEIARETAPAAAQAQLANAQAATIAAEHAQQARETVQQLPALEHASVQDALAGEPNGERPSYRERRRRRVREPVRELVIPLAAAHPRGLGAMVDIRA
jgi:hypothetical protein